MPAKRSRKLKKRKASQVEKQVDDAVPSPGSEESAVSKRIRAGRDAFLTGLAIPQATCISDLKIGTYVRKRS